MPTDAKEIMDLAMNRQEQYLHQFGARQYGQQRTLTVSIPFSGNRKLAVLGISAIETLKRGLI